MARKKTENVAKFNLRLPDKVYERIGKLAERHHRSINSEINNLLEENLAKKDELQAPFYWLAETSPEDRILYATACKYEDLYFEDMTFKADSIGYDFMRYEIQDDSKNWLETYDDLPFYPSISSYRFEVSERGGIAAYYSEKYTIFVHPDYKDNREIILHQMIHAYEDLLLRDGEYSYWRHLAHDILLFCLHNKLKTKITNLNKKIIEYGHFLTQERITTDGGFHGILFFLKSLDLDLRLGMKLGTVCGYGRDEFLNDTGEEI
jgi:hypothetical protein